MITFISGSMFGAKSKLLIHNIEKVHNNYEAYLVFKPTNDTRDGLFVKSRDLPDITIEAIPWNVSDKSMKYKFLILVNKMIVNSLETVEKNIFIDEAHFISEDDMDFIVTMCKNRKINLMISGLETSFKMEQFPSTAYLIKHCDHYIFLHGTCNSCGQQNAVYNILYDKDGNRITNGESIHPGDSEYKVLCQHCVN